MKIKITPIFTMLITGHGNLKSYLHKFKIVDNANMPMPKRGSDCGSFTMCMRTPAKREG
jgi:hypothetical protein